MSDDPYIKIGKYDQFLPGWDDYIPIEGGKSGVSQNRDYYWEIRNFRQREQDKYNRKANIYFIGIAANHLLSVIDTIWGIKRNTIYRSRGWSWDMNSEMRYKDTVHILNVRYRW
jgi:hypothetical protein